MQNFNIKSTANIEPQINPGHIGVHGDCGILFESN